MGRANALLAVDQDVPVSGDLCHSKGDDIVGDQRIRPGQAVHGGFLGCAHVQDIGLPPLGPGRSDRLDVHALEGLHRSPTALQKSAHGQPAGTPGETTATSATAPHF